MTPPNVAAAFAHQSIACRDLDSPFMAQLCGLFARRDWPDTPVRDRIFEWAGDLSPAGDSVPLRLAGALHALHLKARAFEGVYPPQKVSDDTLWNAVGDAMEAHDAFINQWIDSPPQTNEVRRSAVLIALGHALADRFPMPFSVRELGASGGLNLAWDRYGLQIGDQLFGNDDILTLTPEWDGPLPPKTAPKVTSQAGVDLNPLDPKDPDDALRLQAYLWPDQPERLARTQAAISAASVPVTKGDAIDWLAANISQPPETLQLIYHTVAWQYFPKAVQDRGTALIEAAGAKATNSAPLAWFGMESDGATNGAALTLRLWPGDLRFDLGRADFHGRWINWKGM